MRFPPDAWLKIRSAAAALAVGLAGMATAPTAVHRSAPAKVLVIQPGESVEF